MEKFKMLMQWQSFKIKKPLSSCKQIKNVHIWRLVAYKRKFQHGIYL